MKTTTKLILYSFLALALFGCKKFTNPYDILDPKGQWEEVSNFPGESRQDYISFVIGDKAYIGLGASVDTSKYINDLWEYDAANDSWAQKADFPGGDRFGSVAFSVGDKGYVTLGEIILDFDNVKTIQKYDLWQYNPSTDTWMQKKGFPGTIISHSTAFTIENKAYVCLGADSNMNYIKEVWEYSPTSDSWTRKADFPGKARIMASSFTIGIKGYVCLGQYSYYTNYGSDLWEYNAANDSWTQKAGFPGVARADAPAFSLAGKGYVGLGYYQFSLGQGQYGGGSPNDFWEYDAANDLWTQKANFPGTNNWGFTGFTINDYGHIIHNADGCWKYSRY